MNRLSSLLSFRVIHTGQFLRAGHVDHGSTNTHINSPLEPPQNRITMKNIYISTHDYLRFFTRRLPVAWAVSVEALPEPDQNET